MTKEASNKIAGPTPMRWKRQEELSRGLGVWACVLASILAGLAMLCGPLAPMVANLSYDLLFLTRPVTVPDEVVMVYLDDESHDILEQPYDRPWDRAWHTELLANLKDAGARAAVFDIVFDQPSSDPDKDAELAAAMKDFGNVFLAGGNVTQDRDRVTVMQPLQLFQTNSAGWGVAVFAESDGIRRLPNHVAGVPTLSFVVARNLSEVETPKGTNAVPWLNYYNRPQTIPAVSFHQAIYNENIPTNFFRDRIVVIGALQAIGFSGGGKDRFGTAFSRFAKGESAATAAGAEIQAMAIVNRLRGDLLLLVDRNAQISIAMVIGLLFGFGLNRLRPLWSSVCAVGGLTLLVAVTVILFRGQNTWFVWLAPALQIGVAWLGALVVHSIRSYAEARILQAALSFHVPPARAKQLSKRPELLRTGGNEMTISFMFTDIEDFTTVSDRMVADDLFANMNAYFGTIVPCIHETDGALMQFIGDAVYAIWNAPEQQPDHPLRAIRTALLVKKRLGEYRTIDRAFALRTRIGLHTGEAFVGNYGGEDQFEYSAVGKDTNLASRIEGLNKYLDTNILATSPMIANTGAKEEFYLRSLGFIRLKGSDRIPEVFEVIGLPEDFKTRPTWIQPFEEGVAAYQYEQWDQAEEAFNLVLRMKPGDKPSLIYLEHIARHRRNPPDDRWCMEIGFGEK